MEKINKSTKEYIQKLNSNIGELQEDERGFFRIINRKKIYQARMETEEDRGINNIINRYRASGFSNPLDFLNHCVSNDIDHTKFKYEK